MSDLCGCIKCVDKRIEEIRKTCEPWYNLFQGPNIPGWRYYCEICGNKRCPHHTDHELECTNSNKVGQEGSEYQ